jgi:cellulose synthase (UDP-forming)
VTEDAHTALELHARGWRSVYLGLPLAAGLATESFAAHVTQRNRWARGMAQILRLDCPLFKRGLTLPQRLNYFNAMLHFFFGLPRLVMIAAPLLFLLFNVRSFRADVPAVLAYILPHIVLSTLANSLISERFRHSFWGGVYEVSIAPYAAWVTLLAVVNPRLGKFNVTDKGTNIDVARFDFDTSRGTLLLLGLSLAALAGALPLRLYLVDPARAAAADIHAVLINALWALANLVVLVAAACVAYEQPQQRRAPRVRRDFSCTLAWPGATRRARFVDVSESGLRVELEAFGALPDACRVDVSGDVAALSLSGRRVWCERRAGGRVEAGLSLEAASPESQRRLVELIFCGERSWMRSSYPRDDPFRSFGYMLTTLWRVTRPRRPSRRRAPRVSGRVACRVDGRAGACLVLSSRGALLENTPLAAGAGRVRVELEGWHAGSAIALDGHVVAQRDGGTALAWDEPAAAALEALEELLAARQATATKRRRLSRAEALWT